MAKKIKFPLDMGNDIKVRTIDELKEHYDAEKVMSYFLDGQLLVWLNDRYYDEEAEQVSALSDNNDNADISAELARIFGIELTDEIDVEAVKYRNEKLSRLREITSDDEILSNVDKVAFSQEELGDLLDEGYDVIYLCGDVFRIPYGTTNMTYFGVNNPTVEIKSKDEIDLDSRNISVQNCKFSDETKDSMAEKVIPTFSNETKELSADDKPKDYQSYIAAHNTKEVNKLPPIDEKESPQMVWMGTEKKAKFSDRFVGDFDLSELIDMACAIDEEAKNYGKK